MKMAQHVHFFLEKKVANNSANWPTCVYLITDFYINTWKSRESRFL